MAEPAGTLIKKQEEAVKKQEDPSKAWVARKAQTTKPRSASFNLGKPIGDALFSPKPETASKPSAVSEAVELAEAELSEPELSAEPQTEKVSLPAAATAAAAAPAAAPAAQNPTEDANAAEQASVAESTKNMGGAYEALFGSSFSRRQAAHKGETYKCIAGLVDFYQTMPSTKQETVTEVLATIEKWCHKWQSEYAGKSRRARGFYDDTRAEVVQELLERVAGERKLPRMGQLQLNVQKLPKGCGHSMDINLDVQLPHHPIVYADGSVGGVRFEYWEKITVLHQFNAEGMSPEEINEKKESHQGGEVKEWNDILAIAPMVLTFCKFEKENNTQNNETMSLSRLIGATKDTGIAGEHTIHFEDRPATNLNNKLKWMKRILEFRIVAMTDNGEKREILCNQIMRLENGQVASAEFNYGAVQQNETDEKRISGIGNAVDADGKANNQPVAAESLPRFNLNIPPEAMQQVGSFYRAALEGHAEAFDYTEDATVRGVENGQPYDENYKGMALLDLKTGLQVAGLHLMAFPITGDRYVQQRVGGKDMLVAILNGKKVRRMYYTTGEYDTGKYHSRFDVSLRRFREIPVEWAQEYAKAPLAPSAGAGVGGGNQAMSAAAGA